MGFAVFHRAGESASAWVGKRLAMRTARLFSGFPWPVGPCGSIRLRPGVRKAGIAFASVAAFSITPVQMAHSRNMREKKIAGSPCFMQNADSRFICRDPRVDAR